MTDVSSLGFEITSDILRRIGAVDSRVINYNDIQNRRYQTYKLASNSNTNYEQSAYEFLLVIDP